MIVVIVVFCWFLDVVRCCGWVWCGREGEGAGRRHVRVYFLIFDVYSLDGTRSRGLEFCGARSDDLPELRGRSEVFLI